MSKMAGTGTVVAKPALDLQLFDQHQQQVRLSEEWAKSALMLVFYPGDFTPVCTAQLCNYRDNYQDFQRYGLEVFGISPNSAESHQKFVEEYQFPFRLLSDPDGIAAKGYGCQSVWMFGKSSRAVFIINRNGVILYRYVEPTVLTRRKADELFDIVKDLKNHNLI